MLRAIVTTIVVGLIFLVWVFVGVATESDLVAGLVFLALAAALVATGFKRVPATPPSRAVLTLFGRRTSTEIDEGLSWAPLRPLVFDLIFVKVEKVNTSFLPQEVRTPDRAVLKVRASMTWKAGIEGVKGSLKTFLDSGGSSGVETILARMTEDRSKSWAASNKEGPSGWMEALTLRNDAHAALTRALLGEALSAVESPIPTSTLMRYFDGDQPSDFDALPQKGWASKNKDAGTWSWAGLEAIINGKSEDDRKKLKAQVEKRKEEVKALREGRGKFGLASLGITVFRFSLDEADAVGKVAEQAEQQEKERQQQMAEKVEIQNFADRTAQLRAVLPDLSAGEALQAVQVILEKVPMRVVKVEGAKTPLGQDLMGLGALGGLPGQLGVGSTPNTGGGPAPSTDIPPKPFSEMSEAEKQAWAESRPGGGKK